MAIIDVLVPQLSESVSEATLMEWKKQPGEAVEMDEILIEIETDKVVLEVPAPSDGVMSEIVKGDGSTVGAEEVIARIDSEGKATAAASSSDSTDKDDEQAPAEQQQQSQPAAASETAASSGVASPAASKILSEKGIDPATVTGTGK